MRGCLTTIITLIILFALKPGRPPLVHMDRNYHSTDYITKDSCQSKSHYCNYICDMLGID